MSEPVRRPPDDPLGAGAAAAALKSGVVRGLWRTLRGVMAAHEVLNEAAPAMEVPARPDRGLYRAAQAVKAVAVDRGGRRVDYEALAKSEAYGNLRRLTCTLPLCRLQDLGGRRPRLAFWINLYNALILDAIVCFGVEERVSPAFFQRAAYNVCGHRFSADDIEHGVLRGNRPHPLFRLRPFPPNDPRRRSIIEPFDPRIHFALNCGARSCPPIAFYEGDRIDDQLRTATASFLNGGGADVDLDLGTLHLSKILDWYGSDFGGREGVLSTVADHLSNEEEAEAVRSGELRILYRDYNWSVNQVL